MSLDLAGYALIGAVVCGLTMFDNRKHQWSQPPSAIAAGVFWPVVLLIVLLSVLINSIMYLRDRKHRR